MEAQPANLPTLQITAPQIVATEAVALGAVPGWHSAFLPEIQEGEGLSA